MDWTAGYVTDLEYTHGYYRELSPGMLRLACLNAGVAPPTGKSLTYLELGFGQGLSVNIHAATNPGVFWGTDFNPTQAAHAAALAESSGSEAILLDASFAELAARPDLPEFDVIALHGVWTWISEENRQVIVDIIRRKLRVGGVAYLSYNCFPGWAPMEPLRHLMMLHSELASSDAFGTGGKVEAALKFVHEVTESGALYFKANPAVVQRLKQMQEQNRSYLAHEYFNRDWDLMSFSEVARHLDQAKVSFVASAHLLDHIDTLNLPAEAQKLMAGIQHPVLRQSVRDYLVGQQFRRDIFVKGPRRLTPLERHEALMAESVIALAPPEQLKTATVAGALGQATLQEAIYGPLLAILAENDFAPKTLERIAAHPKAAGIQSRAFVEAIVVLVGAGHAHPARTISNSTRQATRALNRRLCLDARSAGDIAYLASPVTGSGISVPRFHQLFLLAAQQGKKTVEEQVKFVWGLLEAQGQRLLHDGKTLQSPEENQANLTRMAEEFTSARLPILKALEIA
jgi:SAM-dependent methyltransferase